MMDKNQITIDDLIQGFEALRSEAFTRESLITEQEEEIDELKKECEELKERIQKYEKYGGIIDEGREWAALATHHRNILQEIVKYFKK